MEKHQKEKMALDFLKTAQSTSSLMKHIGHSDSSNHRLIRELKKKGLIKEAIDNVPAGNEKYYIVSPELSGGVIWFEDRWGRVLPLEKLLKKALEDYRAMMHSNYALGAIVHLFRYSYYGSSKDVMGVAQAGRLNEHETKLVLGESVKAMYWLAGVFENLIREDRLWDGENIATKFGITDQEVAQLEKDLIEVGENWQRWAEPQIRR